MDEYVHQLAADHLVHGWDLAVATGGDTRLDPALVAEVAGWYADREDLYRQAGDGRGAGGVDRRPAGRPARGIRSRPALAGLSGSSRAVLRATRTRPRGRDSAAGSRSDVCRRRRAGRPPDRRAVARSPRPGRRRRRRPTYAVGQRLGDRVADHGQVDHGPPRGAVLHDRRDARVDAADHADPVTAQAQAARRASRGAGAGPARAARRWPGGSVAAARRGGLRSAFEPSVGSTSTPAAATSASTSSGVWMPSSVSDVKCSRPSTAAATACRMPRSEWVWASTRRPASCAQSTSRRRSSRPNCTPLTSLPSVAIPPLAITLTTSTPRSTRSPIAARTAVGAVDDAAEVVAVRPRVRSAVGRPRRSGASPRLGPVAEGEGAVRRCRRGRARW